jgi:hypothetical protein
MGKFFTKPGTWYRDIRDGIIDEVINIRALGEGDQIALCKTHNKLDERDRIFLVAKGTFGSDFTPSEKGRQWMYHPITEHETVEYLARIVDVLPIPGLNRNFWEELNAIGEFDHWEIERGPIKYFSRARKSKQLLWLLQVYSITPPEFALEKGVDFETHPYGYRIKESGRAKLEQATLKPVIEKGEFDRRRENIKAIVGKYNRGA